LLQCIEAHNNEPALLLEHLRSSGLDAEPAWMRLYQFCAAWADDATPLHDAVRDIWLEFDLDERAASSPEALGAPIPSVFFGFYPKFPASERFAAINFALPLLLGMELPPLLHDSLWRGFENMPEGAVVSHIGVMLSRAVGALRVNVQHIGLGQIEPYLTQLGWQPSLRGFAPSLERVYELVEHVTLCLDIGATIYPRLGLECASNSVPDRVADLTPLIDDLVERKLCTPQKHDALLHWEGVTSPTTTNLPWPERLITRSLTEPPESFTIIGRRLSHIKLSFTSGRPVEAKGYIGFGHLWVKPKTAAIEPIVALQSLAGTEGLPRADHVRTFQFPKDHGPHDEYQTEWWYYTGNVSTQAGRRFGYQLTFFRRRLTPSKDTQGGDAPPQLYFAHFAITDVERNLHLKAENASRTNAGATGNPFRVWIENWSIDSLNQGGSRVRLKAEGQALSSPRGNIALDLTLKSVKPLILQGNAGLSQKTNAVGNASYYLSFSRLETEGVLNINGEAFTVNGFSWMDHEWGTTELGPRAVGWDWFSIQLDDQREVMFYHLRNKDGSVEPLSSGTLVEADGSYVPLALDQVKLEILEKWQSRVSPWTYPSRWRLVIPSANLDLHITPLVADQEMPSSHTYWEGAVKIEGLSNGAPVMGSGYVELTGYGHKVGEAVMGQVNSGS
jgi:predicted secreted hydrolase